MQLPTNLEASIRGGSSLSTYYIEICVYIVINGYNMYNTTIVNQ